MLSEFNQAFTKALGEKIPGFAYQAGKKNVRLIGTINGRSVNFANLRSATTKRADVWLKCYRVEETTLTKKQREEVYPDGRAEIFFRTPNLELAVDAVERHFKDISKRIDKYEKAVNGAPKGFQPKQRGAGIPADYFN